MWTVYFQRKTDREEIRRRLAMGSDGDDYFCSGDRINRKPSLQSRLQSGMNLQICFMNENTSDTDSINSDSEVENNSIQNSKKFQVDKYPTKRPDSLPVNVSLELNYPKLIQTNMPVFICRLKQPIQKLLLPNMPEIMVMVITKL